jgi:hypothetical protein
VKALTVSQPWAWAIIHGGKTVENRTTNWSYRGPLAIHAGRRWSVRGGNSDLVAAAWGVHLGFAEPCQPLPNYPRFAAGAFIGTVDVVDVHPEQGGCCQPWGEQSYRDHNGTRRVDIVHLVLENARPVDLIPCPGRLGLWTPPADVLLELAKAPS